MVNNPSKKYDNTLDDGGGVGSGTGVGTSDTLLLTAPALAAPAPAGAAAAPVLAAGAVVAPRGAFTNAVSVTTILLEVVSDDMVVVFAGASKGLFVG